MDQVFLPFLAAVLLVSSAYANTLYFQPENQLVCPDSKHSCSSDTTCCLLPDGKYGCCMYANAVCCSDNIHCCPTGSYCDVNAGSCDKDGVQFEWSKKAPAALYIPKKKVKNHRLVENLPPTNMEFQQPQSIPWAEKLPGLKINSLNISSLRSPACSVSQTLCKSDSGLSGCCPFPNAVCCDKGQQCCPSGFQCNLKSSKCEKPTEEMTKEITSLLPGNTLWIFGGKTKCPDGITVCADTTTCCSLGNGSYACCPYSQATCCSDNMHCCPHGYTCDLSAGRCVRKQVNMILVKMTKWIAGQMCPDKETTCPEGATCCPIQGGSYGCCPYPQAVCCSDNYHCCPRGYTCDVKASKCQIMPHGLTCPDHQTLCSTGMTCCLIKEDVYGCCPFPQATCCSDDYHCCPHDFKCDLQAGRCVKSGIDVQSAVKRMIVCPNKKTQCQDTQTCCALQDKTYGCCSYPKATCCRDDSHCCPNGYDCDMVAKRCVHNVIGSSELSIDMLAIQSSDSMRCPDKSPCPTGTTCCPTDNGYNCCPMPEAKCCSDMKHCCPDNFICDPIRGRCRIKTSTKEVSLTGFSVDNIIYSCNFSQCPPGSTFCPLNSILFGCCPLPKAVCCHDNRHCCPKNYHCDLEHMRCVMGQTSLPLFKKMLPSKSLTALKAPKKKFNYVMCPDYSECPDRSTCCLMDTGAWGCCPYLNAVCCIDRKHCCPKSYFCDMKQSKCVSSQSSLNQIFGVIYSKIEPPK